MAGFGRCFLLLREKVYLGMQTGTVKWFSDAKGYGFISTEDHGEVFVHYSANVATGRRTLKEGQAVHFDIVEGPKGLQAANVTVD